MASYDGKYEALYLQILYVRNYAELLCQKNAVYLSTSFFSPRQVYHYVEADQGWNQLWHPPALSQRTLSLR